MLKSLGFTERSTGVNWVFGFSRYKVDVCDFRDDVLGRNNAEWVDDTGWDHKWAVRVSLHSRRNDSQYALWHCISALLSQVYDSSEIWLDGGSKFPQEPYTIEELFPDFKSNDGEDLAPGEVPVVSNLPPVEPTTPVEIHGDEFVPEVPMKVVESPAPSEAVLTPLDAESSVQAAEVSDVESEDDWDDGDDWWAEDEAESEESEDEEEPEEESEEESEEEDEDEDADWDDDDDDDDGIVNW